MWLVENGWGLGVGRVSKALKEKNCLKILKIVRICGIYSSLKAAVCWWQVNFCLAVEGGNQKKAHGGFCCWHYWWYLHCIYILYTSYCYGFSRHLPCSVWLLFPSHTEKICSSTCQVFIGSGTLTVRFVTDRKDVASGFTAEYTTGKCHSPTNSLCP